MKAELEQTCRVFAELRAYIAQEPQLSKFLAVAMELEAQARQLAKGETEVGALAAVPPTSIPSRALAENVIEIIAGLPAIGDDFDERNKRGLARLLENLVLGITGTVFREFPDVIPHA